MGASLQLMGRYRFVLDINPMFACGLHDRVTSAWANGAVCITDMSLEFDKEIRDERNVIAYSENRLDRLISRLQSLSEEEAYRISQNGLLLAKQKYNWNAHGHELLSFIKQIHA
jgi:hypothetical protein